MYVVWVKIDKKLPWIELKGEYQTKIEAREAATRSIESIQTKIISTAQNRRTLKASVVARN